MRIRVRRAATLRRWPTAVTTVETAMVYSAADSFLQALITPIAEDLQLYFSGECCHYRITSAGHRLRAPGCKGSLKRIRLWALTLHFDALTKPESRSSLYSSGGLYTEKSSIYTGTGDMVELSWLTTLVRAAVAMGLCLSSLAIARALVSCRQEM